MVVIDEVHLLAEWKVFRPAFTNWSWFRALIPTRVPIAACTATLALGTPYKSILKAMGFEEESPSRAANFQLIKLDTERRNIAVHIRRIEHSVSGWKFADLEWLIRDCAGKEPTLWPKTIIYCEEIDLGHRVVHSLRRLLPDSLRHQAHTLIRHIHSLRCPRCKQDAVNAFGAPAAIASCRIVVATDAFGMGIDIPDIARVILFRSPRTLSSAIQRIGRAARNPELSGQAIIYVDKSEISLLEKGADVNASEAVNMSETKRDARECDTEEESGSDNEDGAGGNCDPRSSRSHKAGSSQRPGTYDPPLTPQATTAKSRRKEKCAYWIEVMTTWLAGDCFIQTINNIYGNPGEDHPCGRCSNCIQLEDLSETSLGARALPLQTDLGQSDSQCQDLPETATVHPKSTPKWRRLTRDMRTTALKELEEWSSATYFADDEDQLFLTEDMLFPPTLLDSIVSSLLDVTDTDALKLIADNNRWLYWGVYGHALTEKVADLRQRFLREVVEKHEEVKMMRTLRRKEKTLEAKIRQAREQAALKVNKRNTGKQKPWQPRSNSAQKPRIKISGRRDSSTRPITVAAHKVLVQEGSPASSKLGKQRNSTHAPKRGAVAMSPGASPQKKRTRHRADKENSGIT